MDLLDGHAADPSFSSSSSDSEDALQANPNDRLKTPVGHTTVLPDLQGQPVGDNIRSKGSLATRVVCIQCGSTGLDRLQWGLWFGHSASILGADIAILSETALVSASQHAQACRGLLQAGYQAISHGRPEQPEHSAAGAAGVILAVRSGYAGQWTHISRDSCGRGLAASLLDMQGVTLRVVALYGPVGASHPNFPHSLNSPEEAPLKAFIDSQIRLSKDNGWVLLVGGDLNSVASVALDTWHGGYIQRPECIASSLEDRGLIDTFRARHSNLQAFTYFSHAGSASRLDSLWLLPSECEIAVLNAAILWNWDRRVDHEPVLADLDLRLPSLPPAQENNRPWKQLVRRINTDLPALIATHIQHHAPDLRRLTLAVHEVVREWHTLPQPACEGLDGLHGVPSLPTPSRLITAAHAIHDELMCILSSSLPKPTSSANCKMSRVASAWQACVLELRRLKRVIQADVTASHGLLRPWQVSLEPLQDLWAKAQSMTQHYQHRRVSPAAHMPPWDCFRTDPQRWARNLGFHDPDVLANIPTAVEPASPEASANCHSPDRVDSTDINWQVLLASGTTPSRCLARLDEWLNYVLKRHTSQTSNYIRTLRQNRLQLLRQGDVSAWAKRMKPSSSPNPSYSPDWVTDDSGHKHRPTSRADVLVGAKQEWGRLLQEPTSCWQHDAVLPFSDVHQLRRGSINFQALSQAAPGSVLAAVCNAMLTSGPWRIVLLQAGQIRVINPGCIVAGSWVLYLRTFWEATLPGPCPGPTHFVVALDGSPHHTLTADQFQQASTRASHLLLRLAQPPDYSAVGPVSATEKRWLLAKFRNSRPGPSGWKICYIEAFCDAIQSTYWDCLNMLRLLGTAPPSLLYAEQVHLPKPAGGWRPLSMLEESLKAVEAPVISRLSSGRDPSLPDSPYSSLNRAYCKGVAAAAEVLYLDCLICEDAVRSGLPLLRIPADYEKFFNVLQLQEVDAMQQARGLPDAVRRLHQALFANMKVLLATRAGLTDPLPVSRGIPQGAVSSPELSRAAQDPILRLRAQDGAAYITSAGRRVTAAGYVDDIEHYGAGLRDLPAIRKSLQDGSRVSGVGFAWSKFSAYASDWDGTLPLLDPNCGITAQGAAVCSWDIWKGGVKTFNLPRSDADTVDKLLGKRGTVLDRHSLAISDLLEKLAAVRRRLASKHCAWDEILAMMQWVLGGILNYGPLLGIPAPADLHREDAAFHRLLHASLGTRSTSERVSLSAPRATGGLGVPLVTEMLVAAVASDLLTLLNGRSQAADVARDTLRLAYEAQPAEVAQHEGLVTQAMRFLAGYGLYINVSTDRFVSRVLDQLNRSDAQPLHGPFEPARFLTAARYCRVSSIANTVRAILKSLARRSVPTQRWSDLEHWLGHVPLDAPASPQACAQAVATALQQANSDWCTECSWYQVPCTPSPDEDWDHSAWQDPWSNHCDPRANHLLTLIESPGPADFALFGDGGFDLSHGATFCCQARGFGPPGNYWSSAAWASQKLLGRLPRRYGWEHSSIHTAEMQALTCSLRFRTPNAWQLLVFDRSSLFNGMHTALAGSLHHIQASACIPQLSIIRRALLHLRSSWASAPKPSWKLHQETYPKHWEAKLVDPTTHKSVTLSRIAYESDGVVGLDIKSHQTDSTSPFPAAVHGNEVQDKGCLEARSLPLPADVRVPTAGLFAWVSDDGRMVTGPIRSHIRTKLRESSKHAWCSRAVQGLVPRLEDEIFLPALDPALYVQCVFPSPRWGKWMLSTDQQPLDLSAMAYRCQRAIGGSWTERLHAHADDASLASAWCTRERWNSSRTCPLCQTGPGTPRHVVMSCPAMTPLVDILRDDLELELRQHATVQAHSAAALRWRESLSRTAPAHVPGPCSHEQILRWPILSSWRWLLAIPTREAYLSVDINESSSTATARERGTDLAHRAVMPKWLGAFLCKLTPGDLQALVNTEIELHATLRQSAALQSELKLLAKHHQRALPATKLVQCLLLGLRRIRQEYQSRLTAWLALCRSTLPLQPEEPAPNPRRSALDTWLASPTGARSLRETRWALLCSSAAVSRLRACSPAGRTSDAQLIRLLHAHGVPLLVNQVPSWGADYPSWQKVLDCSTIRCQCPHSGAVIRIAACWTCGGIDWPTQENVSHSPCPWCKQSGPRGCVACNVSLHQRGQCRWNMGAHPAYGNDAASAPLSLCPDCWTTYAHSLGRCPRRRRMSPLPEALLSHMRGLAESCIPAAGSEATLVPELRLRRVRKWLLSHIRTHGRCSMDSLLPALQLRVPAADASRAHAVIGRASRALCVEGRAYFDEGDLCPIPR